MEHHLLEGAKEVKAITFQRDMHVRVDMTTL